MCLFPNPNGLIAWHWWCFMAVSEWKKDILGHWQFSCYGLRRRGLCDSLQQWALDSLQIIHSGGCKTGLPLVRKKSGKFKVRGKSEDFGIGQGNLKFYKKSGEFKKGQGTLALPTCEFMVCCSNLQWPWVLKCSTRQTELTELEKCKFIVFIFM